MSLRTKSYLIPHVGGCVQMWYDFTVISRARKEKRGQILSI